jgi:chromate reductase
VRLLGICGSLRRDSYNRRLLRAAARLVPGDVVFELWPGIAELPIYNEELDVAQPAPAVMHLRASLADADALLFATPEYNSSVPGGLKNALDWASRPYATNVLRLKPVAVVGASTGFFGAVWAQAELRKVLAACGARVLDRQLPLVRAADAFEPDGSLADPELAGALLELVHELIRLARPKTSALLSDRRLEHCQIVNGRLSARSPRIRLGALPYSREKSHTKRSRK